MGAKNETDLEEHSRAKIELYSKYLSIYLNIIARVDFIDTIFLFDLFAGEGTYENNQEGSSIAAIHCIKNHYFANDKSCPKINILFNDFGKSKIEPDKSKIERIKSLVEKEFIPPSVNVEYSETPYSELINSIIPTLSKILRNQRALLFIDPWGYKDINPTQLRALMHNGQTEVLLFLPIYHMYRFADKALAEGAHFPGGKPLEKFLLTLFDDQKPNTNSNLDFIESLSEQFKSFLQVRYTDTFVIEREKGNFFCLFFFTNNKKGYQKMLESKWSLDEAEGKGFTINENPGQFGLFNVVETNNYLEKVKKYLRENPDTTNIELFDFGLNNRHLPKHTKVVLDKLKGQGLLEINSLDDLPARGYYLDNSDRLIHIKLR